VPTVTEIALTTAHWYIDTLQTGDYEGASIYYELTGVSGANFH